MARYELTINSKYVPSWTVWDGIREVVQNALDGQDDGYEMAIEETEYFVSFTNKGLQLNNSVLLTGTSTKTYRSDQRGQWGEGLKLA